MSKRIARGFFGVVSFFLSYGTAGQGAYATQPDPLTFLVKAGQTILVKGNLEIGADAVIEVRGTLLVEGDMVINEDLNLLVTDQGKLVVKGDVVSNSTLIKNIMVTGAGQVRIDKVFQAGDNMNVITDQNGRINAQKVIAQQSAKIGGTRNFLILSDCTCPQQACNFCNLIPAAKL